MTAEQALADLPPIHVRQFLAAGKLKPGPRRFDCPVPYDRRRAVSSYARTMRAWQGFEAPEDGLRDHVIRCCHEITSCSPGLPVEGDKGPVSPGLRSGLAVNAKKRLVLLRQTPPRSLLVSGKKARLGSRADVQHGCQHSKYKP